ncbi:MAG: LysR family transcriptional regulator [Gammaproteobacteria bacterium]|nr:LysR family transcriptional regulator [Gammaproteobacteria bacterium]
MKHITFRQLAIFSSVAANRSFSRAAEDLHLTQPAVSMQVKQLEEWVGLPLFEQVGKRIYLTEAGTTLAHHANAIAQQLRATDEDLAALRGVRVGRLNIGVVNTAKYFAPRLLAEFRRRCPNIELRLNVQNRERTIALLADNQIDLAIMGSAPQEIDTIAEPFAEHPHVFIAMHDHPLANKRRIPPQALFRENFLVREPGSGTRLVTDRYFAEHKLRPTTMLEMDCNETIKQAVMAGMGIAFLSAHAVALELQVGRLARLSVTGTPVVSEWFAVRRTEKRLPPVAEAFCEFLHREGKRAMAQLLKGNAVDSSPKNVVLPAPLVGEGTRERGN